MLKETKILYNHSSPKFVVQVGDYHGVILIKYTPDNKYESQIDLTLFRDDKLSIFFFVFIVSSNSSEYYFAKTEILLWDQFPVQVFQAVVFQLLDVWNFHPHI